MFDDATPIICNASGMPFTHAPTVASAAPAPHARAAVLDAKLPMPAFFVGARIMRPSADRMPTLRHEPAAVVGARESRSNMTAEPAPILRHEVCMYTAVYISTVRSSSIAIVLCARSLGVCATVARSQVFKPAADAAPSLSSATDPFFVYPADVAAATPAPRARAVVLDDKLPTPAFVVGARDSRPCTTAEPTPTLRLEVPTPALAGGAPESRPCAIVEPTPTLRPEVFTQAATYSFAVRPRTIVLAPCDRSLAALGACASVAHSRASILAADAAPSASTATGLPFARPCTQDIKWVMSAGTPTSGSCRRASSA